MLRTLLDEEDVLGWRQQKRRLQRAAEDVHETDRAGDEAGVVGPLPREYNLAPFGVDRAGKGSRSQKLLADDHQRTAVPASLVDEQSVKRAVGVSQRVDLASEERRVDDDARRQRRVKRSRRFDL